MPRIIDAHVHCSDRSDDALIPYARANGLEYNLGELLSRMEANRIECGLLLSPPMADGRPLPNRDVIALCGKSGDRLLPILTVEPDARSVSAALALAREESALVKGFKVRLGYVPIFADDPVFDRLYDFAIERGLPVLFHTGDTATRTGSLVHAHPLTLDRLANGRTELKIVICHLGNPWILETAELVYKHENVYTDISGLIAGGSPYFEEYLNSLAAKISDAVYYAGGTTKFLFGTDYPVQSHENSFLLVERLKVRKRDLAPVLSENAARLFSI